MQNILAIWQREMRSYFVSPIAYAVLTVFLFLTGHQAWGFLFSTGYQAWGFPLFFTGYYFWHLCRKVAGWNQLADNYVFLESNQLIYPAINCGFGKDSGGFLEGGRRQPAIRA